MSAITRNRSSCARTDAAQNAPRYRSTRKRQREIEYIKPIKFFEIAVPAGKLDANEMQHLKESTEKKETFLSREIKEYVAKLRPQKKTWLFDLEKDTAFKLSRTAIAQFAKCQKCFYLDKKIGIPKPRFAPNRLNLAVEGSLKASFDRYRKLGKPHPIMERAGIEAVPLQCEELDSWRSSGIRVKLADTNFILFGHVDDIWVSKETGRLIVVDYKAGSIADKEREMQETQRDWTEENKKKLELLQWLLRQNGYDVSPKAYVVYCNADSKREWDGNLKFEEEVIAYDCDDSWVEGRAREIFHCLSKDAIPDSGKECELCLHIHESLSFRLESDDNL